MIQMVLQKLIYSDVYHKYENYLIEQKLMLFDTEIKMKLTKV